MICVYNSEVGGPGARLRKLSWNLYGSKANPPYLAGEYQGGSLCYLNQKNSDVLRFWSGQVFLRKKIILNLENKIRLIQVLWRLSAVLTRGRQCLKAWGMIVFPNELKNKNRNNNTSKTGLFKSWPPVSVVFIATLSSYALHLFSCFQNIFFLSLPVFLICQITSFWVMVSSPWNSSNFIHWN